MYVRLSVKVAETRVLCTAEQTVIEINLSLCLAQAGIPEFQISGTNTMNLYAVLGIKNITALSSLQVQSDSSQNFTATIPQR
jgi:3-deoxy-D-arabino-heptulosonate 7-phosphate (DAHP) synthase